MTQQLQPNGPCRDETVCSGFESVVVDVDRSQARQLEPNAVKV
jgi:hypothetical protein